MLSVFNAAKGIDFEPNLGLEKIPIGVCMALSMPPSSEQRKLANSTELSSRFPPLVPLFFPRSEFITIKNALRPWSSKIVGRTHSDTLVNMFVEKKIQMNFSNYMKGASNVVPKIGRRWRL